jgi:hypothetical protein
VNHLLIEAKELLEAKFNEELTPAHELAKEIEAAILKIFPLSFVSASYSTNLKSSISIYFALGRDKSEWANGIVQNDPAYSIFKVWGIGENSTLTDNLELKMLTGGNIYTLPPEGSHLAMGRHKVSFRKSKGNRDKILKGVNTYFKRLKDELKKVGDNIYPTKNVDYSKK